MAVSPAQAVSQVPPRWVRAAGLAMLVAIAVFVSLMALASRDYRGGNWFDKNAVEHDFWLNFLCDLTRDVGINGQHVAGARLGQIGLSTMLAALIPFWLLLPRLFPDRPRLGAIVRVAGVVSAAGALIVPLVPSDAVGDLHGYLVVATAVPGVLAFALGVTGLVMGRRAPRWLLGLAIATLAVAAADAILFTHHVITVNQAHPALAILQRLATLLVLALMTAVSVRALRPEGHRVVAR
jgi:uncharacterized membrane protein